MANPLSAAIKKRHLTLVTQIDETAAEIDVCKADQDVETTAGGDLENCFERYEASLATLQRINAEMRERLASAN